MFMFKRNKTKLSKNEKIGQASSKSQQLLGKGEWKRTKKSRVKEETHGQ